MTIELIVISLVCIVSIAMNVVMVMYSRNYLSRLINASNVATEILVRMDAYREHLTKVYETPTFYGDETLKNLLEHTNDLSAEMTKYEALYSLTQPDLMEQLELASEDFLDDNETQTTQER